MDEFPPPTIATVKQLYGSAFRCAEPTCTKPLYRVHDETADLILNSRVAHIHARRRNGPRWIEMDPEDNRAATNLVLLCLDHSYEVDDPALEDRYPAELLRQWKAGQLDEYQQLQRSWPLSEAEAGAVAEASFGGEHAHVALRVEIARLTGAVVAIGRRSRSQPAAEIDAWRATWDRANASFFAHDSDGRRLTVEPARHETDAHRTRVREALARAGQAVAQPADDLRSSITAASAELPEIAPWLEHLARAVAVVEQAVQRWPEPPPFSDDTCFSDAINELEQALGTLVRRWLGDTTVRLPPEPQADVESTESEDERQLREHDELLERARPHARVDHLQPDLELFAALRASLVVAAKLPPIISHLSRGLDATAVLTAATIKNADDLVWRAAIDSCASIEPLAAGVHLARGLAIIASHTDRQALADRAKACAVARLSNTEWTATTTWTDNVAEIRSLLGMAASELGDEAVRDWISGALTSNPELLPHVLVRCAAVSEQRDSHDIHRLIGIQYGLTPIPTWFPVPAAATAIREQGGPTSVGTSHSTANGALNHLAATVLRVDATARRD